MSIRIETYDGGEVVYIAIDPDGVWAKSTFPGELVTLDFNAKSVLIGIELIGTAARAAANGAIQALLDSESLSDARPDLEDALAPLAA